MQLRARRHTFTFPRAPLLMGIVNLSRDSFSGDGLATPAAALERAAQLLADGADFIDVGAESARTNRCAISAEEEIVRLRSFLELWQASSLREHPLSLNTWRPEVVREILPLGGDLLNDIGGLPTDENARHCAAHGAALLIMHTAGAPKVPQTEARYDDLWATVENFFADKLALANRAGLPRDAIILDPGLDFAKQRDDNLLILRELHRLHRFERPILVPISRKTFIGEVLNLPSPEDRDAGTIACLVKAWQEGAQIFRVHNVRAARQALQILEAQRRE